MMLADGGRSPEPPARPTGHMGTWLCRGTATPVPCPVRAEGNSWAQGSHGGAREPFPPPPKETPPSPRWSTRPCLEGTGPPAPRTAWLQAARARCLLGPTSTSQHHLRRGPHMEPPPKSRLALLLWLRAPGKVWGWDFQGGTQKVGAKINFGSWHLLPLKHPASAGVSPARYQIWGVSHVAGRLGMRGVCRQYASSKGKLKRAD